MDYPVVLEATATILEVLSKSNGHEKTVWICPKRAQNNKSIG
jgi:hypothetical protein